MSYQTSTITRTETITHTDVRYLVWKIKSDMFQLRIFYDCFTQDYEDNMAGDLFQWTYRGYAEKIKFTFFDPNTYQVKREISYYIERCHVVGADEDSGRIPFLDLAGTTFKLLVTTNEAWKTLTVEERQRFYNTLNLQWGTSNLRLSYEGGSWSEDKTYSSNNIAAKRSIYTE